MVMAYVTMFMRLECGTQYMLHDFVKGKLPWFCRLYATRTNGTFFIFLKCLGFGLLLLRLDLMKLLVTVSVHNK
ncbi:hypothetical protein PRUPE_8G168600 [Prunus persica]|uniref:Uncharacterized protein n=1 Tax=Prunus persica TaxID=3760 RepID=A0A251MYZ7_PRUPE|nr:hypothetical protein PRUPE_8G168600 [Prunus persica]